MTQPESIQAKKRLPDCDWGLLAALIIPLVAIIPLLTHAGLPNTADGPAHLMRQAQLNQAWAEGNFYPRWGTDLALGHGMPIFSYAPPLLYQTTQLIHLTGLPLDASMKGVVIIGFMLYSLGMFLFARRMYGPYPALIAATVYLYAPYRLREAFIQGNYGQFMGLAFYPLIFWAFHGLITDGRLRYQIAAPLTLAGLLFSHNISFMLFTPIFAAYLLFLPASEKINQPANQQNRIVSRIFQAVVAGLLGLGIAAIFWLPAFGERHDIKLEGITQGFFDFRENFISLPEFLSPPLPLDRNAINPKFPLGLGLPQIIVVAAVFVVILILVAKTTPHFNKLVKGKQPQREHISRLAHTAFFIAFLLLYGFLALPFSQLLWENIPLLELTEFPWRMLGPAIFCAATLAGAALSLLAHQFALREKTQGIITLSAIVLIIVLNGHYLYPAQFIRWGSPTPAAAFAYEVTSGAIGTTSTGEFLPRWARQHPKPDTLWPDYEAGRPPQLINPATLPDGATVQTVSHRSESDTLHVDTPQAFTTTLRSLYWPGWVLYLDGLPLPFDITPNTGLIQAAIPAGQHILTLQLESTPLRTTGLWFTLISLAALGIAAVIKIVQSRSAPANVYHANDNPPIITARFFAATALTIATLFLVLRPLAPLFTLQSNPDQPAPADHHPQVDFADQIRLVGVDNWTPVVEISADGEAELPVVLYWRAQQDIDTNYSIFLHLDAPNGQTFATIDEVNPENIPTRNWPPGLYLRNPLHLKIPANLPPIRYNLTTGVYNRETGERLPPASGNGTSFNLGPVWVTGPSPNTPIETLAAFDSHITLHQVTFSENSLTLVWQTTQPITQNYSIFIHALDKEGNLLNQWDGVPFDGLYPLPHWLPHQLITDQRAIDINNPVSTLAIGIYNPATGQRLPATDATGQPLPNNSVLISVPR